MQEKFNQALALHRKGQLVQARTLYEEILHAQPEHIEALRLLGLIDFHSGNYTRAIDLFDKAIALKPDYAETYYNRGMVLEHLGQSDAALASYDKAIELNPAHAESYFNRGHTLMSLGRLEAALASYNKVIELKPDLAAAHFNRGHVLRVLDQPQAAIASYDRAITLRPDHAEAYYIRGQVLRALNQPQAALASYDRAIALRPDHAEAYANRGHVLQEFRQFDTALSSYDKAIALQPGFAKAYANRGIVLQALAQLDAALASYDKAIDLNPELADVYVNRGNVLRDLDQLEAAVANYDQAIALQPDLAEAYSNRGNVLRDLKQVEASLSSYDRAIALKPDYVEANLSKSHVLLLAGDLKQGWALYKWRWEKDEFRYYLRYSRHPRWAGDDIPVNKNILLHSEQGIGDAIMFASCIPDLMQQVASCVLLCDPRLVPLFSRSFPSIIAIGQSKDPDHMKSEMAAYATDVDMAIGDLPSYFRSSWTDFPTRSSYLLADEQRRQFWLGRLASSGEGLKVGISWRGGKKTIERSRRSTILEQWQHVCSVPGVHFINLQYGDCQAELQEAHRQYALNIHDWPDVDPLKDLDDFAALISTLDLVISVDNSTVHMAGALGTPVWVLLPYVPEWRWLLERDDSPWYASVRLYRQPAAGVWASVFDRIATDLQALCSNTDVT